MKPTCPSNPGLFWFYVFNDVNWCKRGQDLLSRCIENNHYEVCKEVLMPKK